MQKKECRVDRGLVWGGLACSGGVEGRFHMDLVYRAAAGDAGGC